MEKESLELAWGNLKVKARGLKAAGLLALALTIIGVIALWIVGDHLASATTALLLGSHHAL